MASPEKTGHKPLRSDRDQLKTGGNDKKDTSTIHVTSKDPVYDDITNMESDNSLHDVDFLSMESEYSINEDDFQRMISLEAEYDEAPFDFSGAIVNRQNMFSPTSTYRPPPPPLPPPPIGGSQPHYIEQFNDPVEADRQTSTSKRKKIKGKVNDTFKTKLKNKKKTLEYSNALDEMRLSLSGVKGKVYDAPKTKLLSTKETSGNSKPLDDEMMLSVPDSKVGRDKSPTVIQRLKGLFKRKNDYEHPSDIDTDTEIPNQTHPPRDISKEFTKREDSPTPEKIDPYSHAKRKDEPFPKNTEFRPSRDISKGFTKRENKPTSKNIEPDAHTYTEIGLPKGSSSTETLEDSRPEARDSDSTETHENFRPGAIVSPLVVQAQIEIYRGMYKLSRPYLNSTYFICILSFFVCVVYKGIHVHFKYITDYYTTKKKDLFSLA